MRASESPGELPSPWARGYGGNVGGLFVSNAGGYLPEIPSAYGGCFKCAGEWGPGTADERHRLASIGIIELARGFQVSPAFTVASALPYQIYRANSPSGYGELRCSGLPQPGPAGEEVSVNAPRGSPSSISIARVSKVVKMTESRSLTGFLELYNLIDRANFGANYGTNAFAPATFQKPLGYIGGLPGSSATVPASFQIQLGARFFCNHHPISVMRMISFSSPGVPSATNSAAAGAAIPGYCSLFREIAPCRSVCRRSVVPGPALSNRAPCRPLLRAT